MNRLNFVIISLVILGVVVAGSIFVWQQQIPKYSPGRYEDSSGLRVGRSALYVADQLPGDKIKVSLVHLEKPGFLVIHEDRAGYTGKIIGSSELLSAGETQNPSPVMLSRITTDGEVIYAMLHFDNGNSVFKESEDKPALDSISGEPVMMIVMISNDVEEPGAINP